MSLPRLLAVYATLLLLLAASVWLAGTAWPFKGVLIMALASLQALVLLFGFTRLQDNGPLLRLVALAAWFFLLLLFLMPILDLLTR